MKEKKQLDLSKRRKIEQGVYQHFSIRKIGLMIDANHTTVSRETQHHRVPSDKTCKPYILNNCVNRKKCEEQALCIYPPEERKVLTKRQLNT